MHVFVDQQSASKAASVGTYGGEVGYLLSKGLLTFLNSTRRLCYSLLLPG